MILCPATILKIHQPNDSIEPTRPRRTRREPVRFQDSVPIDEVSIHIASTHILPSFKESREQELHGLMENDVFQLIDITEVSDSLSWI